MCSRPWRCRERIYAANPELRGVAARETDRALRDVLGYRLYLDLRRGWRVTSPNLEQTGLLRIDYLALEDAAADDDLWAVLPPGPRRRLAASCASTLPGRCSTSCAASSRSRSTT